ncbi:MAG TPA: calcium-binding protein [Rhizomicrobium sp.]
MATIQGTNGNDFIAGGASPAPPRGYDFIREQGSGNLILPGMGSDIVYPARNDLIDFGAWFDPHDSVHGSLADTVMLDGDYAGGLTITGHMLYAVAELELGAGFDYSLTLADSAVVSSDLGGLRFIIDASALDAGDTFVLNAAGEKDESYAVTTGAGSSTVEGTHVGDVLIAGPGTNVFFGNAGSDKFIAQAGTNTLHGGAGNDLFVVSDGGSSSISGDGGDDSVEYTGAFAKPFAFDGGEGVDVLLLEANQPNRVEFSSANLANVERIELTPCGEGIPTYLLAIDDSAVAAGQTLTIDASALSGPSLADIDGSAVVSGRLHFIGSTGTDIFAGGAGDDIFEFFAGNSPEPGLVATDEISGGGGTDTLILAGDYYPGIRFMAATIRDIGTIDIGKDSHTGNAAGQIYNFTTNDGNVAAGATLTINASALNTVGELQLDGSAETDGRFAIAGGAGSDTLIGGAGGDSLSGGGGDDILTGGLGADVLTGGAGRDHFVFNAAADSTSVNFDTITDFDAEGDKLTVSGPVRLVDAAVTHGSLSHADFDASLAADIGAAQLRAQNAVLFTPDAGTYAGRTFLIVDLNGVAGYQAGQDLVIALTNPANMDHFASVNFR